MKLDGNGAPDPGRSVRSSGQPRRVHVKKDWNEQKTFTGRASLLWQPTETFNAQLAFMYSDLEGQSRCTYAVFSWRPLRRRPARLFFQQGGDIADSPAPRNPTIDKNRSCASLDLSYDAGFATLSSTTSRLPKAEGSSPRLSPATRCIGWRNTSATTPASTLKPRFILPQVYQRQAPNLLAGSASGVELIPITSSTTWSACSTETGSRVATWIVTNPGSDGVARWRRACTRRLLLLTRSYRAVFRCPRPAASSLDPSRQAGVQA